LEAFVKMLHITLYALHFIFSNECKIHRLANAISNKSTDSFQNQRKQIWKSWIRVIISHQTWNLDSVANFRGQKQTLAGHLTQVSKDESQEGLCLVFARFGIVSNWMRGKSLELSNKSNYIIQWHKLLREKPDFALITWTFESSFSFLQCSFCILRHKVIIFCLE
jgi:hypothetical protein